MLNQADRENPRDLTCPWWVVGMLGALFVVLAFVVHGPNTLQIDQNVSDWVQSYDGQFAESLARFGNALGWWPFSVSALVIASVGLAVARQQRDLWFILIVALGRLCAMPFKELIESPRPAGDEVILRGAFDHYGYPSGHTITSALVLGSIAFILAHHTRNRNIRIVLFILWMLGIGFTAYARIWYGAHWFTDTVAGATYGVLVVLIAANLSASITAKRSIVRQTQPRQMPAQ
jgi:membrane-associated phospholipid phosphatase